MCVFGQHFLINAYFIEQYRQVLSTYFCICPFQLLNWFYGVWQELVDETLITNCCPSTFFLILGYHQGCVYCKRDVIFACTLLLCKFLLFILVCCSVLFISISSSSSLRHLSTLVLDLKWFYWVWVVSFWYGAPQEFVIFVCYFVVLILLYFQ